MPELSRPLPLGRLGGATLAVEVRAEAPECRRVAERLRIVAVERLEASWTLRRTAPGIVDAGGRLQARVVQECVVTLEPFASTVEDTFVVRFVPAAELADDGDALDPEAIDDIPYQGDQIDLGEATVEQLALALDPFPRKPGAELPDLQEVGQQEVGRQDGDETASSADPLTSLRARRTDS